MTKEQRKLLMTLFINYGYSFAGAKFYEERGRLFNTITSHRTLKTRLIDTDFQEDKYITCNQAMGKEDGSIMTITDKALKEIAEYVE